jgi:hypothetical protein
MLSLTLLELLRDWYRVARAQDVAVAPNATILYQLRVPALSAFSLVGFQVAVEPPQ